MISVWVFYVDTRKLTFVENVAHGTVVQNHDFTQIWLHLSEILDVCSVAEGAVLAVVTTCKVLALDFQPVNNWVGVLLNRGCEDDEVVPFGNLHMLLIDVCGVLLAQSYLLQELIAEWSLMDVV